MINHLYCSDLDSFDESFTKTLTPIKVDKEWTVFKEQINCPGKGIIPTITANATVLFDIDVLARITFGIAVSGTLIPFEIDEFGIVVGMCIDPLPRLMTLTSLSDLDGQFNATLTAQANGTVSV